MINHELPIPTPISTTCGCSKLLEKERESTAAMQFSEPVTTAGDSPTLVSEREKASHVRAIPIGGPEAKEQRTGSAVVLSIVMPVYNESETIVQALDRVLSVDYPCPMELIVVNDGSTDATLELLESFAECGVRVFSHSENHGKGAAVRTGVQQANGTHVLILDADLEYCPDDIPSLVDPVLTGFADHVFGTRLFGMNTRFPSYRFAKGGRITTVIANVLFDSCITDMHTCFKLIPLDHFRAMSLSQNGFGLDTELTAKMLRAGIRPYEVPVRYYGRTWQEGKKITWRDGAQCLRLLLAVRFSHVDKLSAAMAQPSGVAVPLAAVSVSRPEGRLELRTLNAPAVTSVASG